MKRLFLLLALAMPFFLYGKEPSIFTPTLSADALVFDDTVATTDSAGGTDLIVRPDTPEDLTVAADTLPGDVLEALLLHLQDLNATPSPARRAGGTVTLLDSSITVDQNGTPTKKMVYDYDERNRNYKTTTYFYTNGIPNGTSQVQEKVFDGTSSSSTILNTKYQWDATSSQWKGQSRTETVYDDTHHTISNVTYSWNPSYTYWTPTASTTYQYDALFRVPEQWTWTIDNSTKKLNPSTRTQQEWDDRNNLILKVVYKGGQNAYGEWLGGSGGTKNIYEYQTYGTANKKVLDEAYTWNTSLNQWVGKTSGKTTWEYTPNGSYETAKVIFNWNNTTAAYDSATATFNGYDANNNIYTISYKWTSGFKSGTAYTRNVFTGSQKDSTLTYSWINNKWIEKTVKAFNIKGKTTLDISWTYSGEIPTASSKKTVTIYNTDNSTVYTNLIYKWNVNAEKWELSSGSKTENVLGGSIRYSCGSDSSWYATGGSKTITEVGLDGLTATIYYTYNTSDHKWAILTGNKSITFTNTDGSSVVLTYTCSNDSIWVLGGSKNLSFIDSQGASIVLKYSCNSDSIWSITSGTKTPADIVDEHGNILVAAVYYCNTDSIWKINSYRTQIFNESNLLIESSSFLKDSVPNSKFVKTYNSQNQVITEAEYKWNRTAQTYLGEYLYEYEYAADNTTLIGNAIYYRGSGSCSTWRGSSYMTWSYNNSGNEIERIVYQWNNSECKWEYSVKYNYEYANTTLMSTYTYTWSSALNDWVITTLNTKTTDGKEMSTSYSSNGIMTSYRETSYVAGTSNVKTTTSITYNTDGTIATYEKTTNYYNTEE